MGLFRQYDYQLGVFASSEVHRGVGLDRTVLARFPTARQLSGSPNPGSSGRDRRFTDEWYQWLDEQDRASPFFGFLYYNAVVAIEPPDGYPTVFPDPQRFAPAASVRALPERGALRRRTGRAGARRPEATEAPRQPDRHHQVGPRDGVGRERPRLQRARRGTSPATHLEPSVSECRG
jgi:hypothetical protein